MLKCICALAICSFIFSCTIKDKKPSSVPVVSAYDSAYHLIKEAEVMLKEGDLILRDGQEFSSQAIKSFSRHDKSYSHAGLVFFNEGYPYVYHIVPDDENPSKKLRLDSLKYFANPRKNAGIGIYRYDMTPEETKQLRSIVEGWKTQGVSFDSTFNPKTDDRMYCSEMIKKGVERATGKRIDIQTTRPTSQEAAFFAKHLRVPVSYASTLDVVAIDNLFVNKHCKEIRRFKFNSQQ